MGPGCQRRTHGTAVAGGAAQWPIEGRLLWRDVVLAAQLVEFREPAYIDAHAEFPLRHSRMEDRGDLCVVAALEFDSLLEEILQCAVSLRIPCFLQPGEILGEERLRELTQLFGERGDGQPQQADDGGRGLVVQEEGMLQSFPPVALPAVQEGVDRPADIGFAAQNVLVDRLFLATLHLRARRRRADWPFSCTCPAYAGD